ncbi:hypothetical protein O3M35_009775 [Rhynocoris fuscipes]|uniref:Uncharacterized protein n=1 Tax=Rhynocoris fuscipes TaxID=488301 RepID=A0AAW1D485_9HEMI
MCLVMCGSFVLCGCGQLVTSEMEKLHESSYMNDWYEQKPKNRRDLLILMTMATKPTVLNYKMFVKFDHVLLMAVIQGLYSFFTMIINLDKS